MDFDNLKKFINIVPNIENNIALICYNSCNLNTDGLNNNTDLLINSIIPNPDSDTTNPIITIKNNNKLFITFNDIEDKNNKYEFKFITFVKDLEENIYLTMIFKNKSDRIIIVKIPIHKTSNVENETDKLLFPIFNKKESISENIINLNFNKFIPTKNSFYFTTIQSNILLIMFKHSIKINDENYDKLLNSIHSEVTTNNILTSPLFFNEGSKQFENKICKSPGNLINSIINEENKESLSDNKKEDNKDKKDNNKEEDDKEDDKEENNIPVINIIILIISVIITIISTIYIFYKLIDYNVPFMILLIILNISSFVYITFYYIKNKYYYLFIIIYSTIVYAMLYFSINTISGNLSGGGLKKIFYQIIDKNKNDINNLHFDRMPENKIKNYITKLYQSLINNNNNNK